MREYRKASAQTSGPQFVEKSSALEARVRVELPISVAEVIDGLSEDIERLTGEAGLLIMKAVMDAEVESLAGPKGRHNPERTSTRWTPQPGYVVLAGQKVKRILSTHGIGYDHCLSGCFQTEPNSSQPKNLSRVTR